MKTKRKAMKKEVIFVVNGSSDHSNTDSDESDNTQGIFHESTKEDDN